jgi:hypothetical protein
MDSYAFPKTTASIYCTDSFGWNDQHLHKFDVFGPVETYSNSNPKCRGHVKEWGKSRLEIGMIRNKDGLGELTDSFGEPRISEDKSC